MEKVIAPQNREAREALTHIASGELTVVAKSSLQERRQMDRIEAQGKKTTRAIIFGSLLIASTLFYTNGDMALAVAGYAATGIVFVVTLLTRA